MSRHDRGLACICLLVFVEMRVIVLRVDSVIKRNWLSELLKARKENGSLLGI